MLFPGLRTEVRFLFVRRDGLGSEGGVVKCLAIEMAALSLVF